MTTPIIRAVLCSTIAVCLAAGAGAQVSSITVDCTGASIPSSGSTAPDIVRLSSPPNIIQASTGYTFAFNPVVSGTGLLGLIAIGSNRQLADVLNGFQAGGQRVLFGAVRNPSGALPVRLDTEPVSGTFSGITVSLTLEQLLLADGRGQAAIRSISKPSGLGLNVNSGGLIVNTFLPPPPTFSEWHFDGNLNSVRDSGLAPSSGSGKLRYLDDAAFGPILGGVGGESTFPSPPTPTGVTLAQSSFGTTTSFGLPPIAGQVDTVYRTSPPRAAAAPTDTARSRGVGLALWPNTREYWPDDRLGQWTIVWDLLIPQASWNSALASPSKQCIPLVEDSQNNNSAADAFLSVSGAGAGQAGVGYSVAISGATPAPAIVPGQWFRLALVVDHYAKAQSRLFVNGALIGTTASDWVYSAVKGSDPRWGDLAAGNPFGSAIAPATWNAWGQFPSPWALSGGTTGAPTASTLGLFCDITGAGESVFVANMLFTDQALSDAAIAALAGPSSRGIQFLRPPPCIADFNGIGGVSVQDIFDFLAAWFANDPRADINGVGGVTVQDIFDFLAAWFTGC